MASRKARRNERRWARAHRGWVFRVRLFLRRFAVGLAAPRVVVVASFCVCCECSITCRSGLPAKGSRASLRQTKVAAPLCSAVQRRSNVANYGRGFFMCDTKWSYNSSLFIIFTKLQIWVQFNFILSDGYISQAAYELVIIWSDWMVINQKSDMKMGYSF